MKLGRLKAVRAKPMTEDTEGILRPRKVFAQRYESVFLWHALCFMANWHDYCNISSLNISVFMNVPKSILTAPGEMMCLFCYIDACCRIPV